MKHYNEVELLERYYIPSPETHEVAVHLAACEPCAQRYERLAAKLQDSACTSTESIDRKPETFWVRQRMSISRKIGEQRGRATDSPMRGRAVAVAAGLSILLASGLLYRSEIARWNQPPSAAMVNSPAPEGTSVSTDVLAAISDPDDAWDSEELKPFGEVVQWESWMTAPANTSGGTL